MPMTPNQTLSLVADAIREEADALKLGATIIGGPLHDASAYNVLTYCARKVESFITAAGADTRAEALVPEGWQLVPVKPTSAMIEAAIHCLDNENLSTSAAAGNAMRATKKEIQLYKVCNRWWAMIAARPALPSPQGIPEQYAADGSRRETK